MPRYSTTDHWIQESIKRIINSGLFWAVGAAEKKNPNCHMYTQYGPIKNGGIKNQHSDFEKNKEPVVRILSLKNRFTF